MASIFFPTEAATIPIDLMAYRSDRRGIKPITSVASEAVVTDWLPARGFHHGQEWRQRSTNRPKIRLQSDPHITTVVSAAVERKTVWINLSADHGDRSPSPFDRTTVLASVKGSLATLGDSRRPRPRLRSVVLKTMGDGQRVGSGHRVYPQGFVLPDPPKRLEMKQRVRKNSTKRRSPDTDVTERIPDQMFLALRDHFPAGAPHVTDKVTWRSTVNCARPVPVARCAFALGDCHEVSRPRAQAFQDEIGRTLKSPPELIMGSASGQARTE